MKICLILIISFCNFASITCLSGSSDVDISIAKLINGFGTATSVPPFAQSENSRPIPPLVINQWENSRQINASGENYGQNTSTYQQGFQTNKSHNSLNLMNGTVIGRTLIINNLDTLPSINTNECHVFLGIPYAAAPVDQLRFQGPKPASRWSGPLEATKYKSACMQNSKALPRSWSINEDCLHVNIFKPAVTNPVPIVVWIHGGAFLTGSATTLNPNTVCRQAVVNTLTVVTVNYRLGPFGFPMHENLSASDTNLGLRDIAQSVRWVQENAQALAGQSERLILVGHGAGAALVSHLLDSGLINPTSIKGAILMSGSGVAPWAVTKYSSQSTSNLLKEFNCQSLECLRKIDASKILEKSSRLWSPYVDNATIQSSFNKGDFRRNDQQKFPMIMGFTIQEGTALAAQKLAPANGQPLKEKVTRSLVDFTGEPREYVERRYLYDRSMPVDYFETVFDFIDALSDAYSDMLFKLPTIREATLRTQQSSNVYVYAIRNDMPLPGNYLPGYKASYHGSDLELFWSPYAKQSRVNLLGAFLQVILHQEDNLPWRPWSIQSPIILQVSPFGGQFVNFRPPIEPQHNQSYYHNVTTKFTTTGWTQNNQPRKFTLTNPNATVFPMNFNRKKITTTQSTPTESASTSTSSSSTPQTSTPTVTLVTNKTINTTNWTSTEAQSTVPSVLINTTLVTATKSIPVSNRSNTTSETNATPNTQQDSLVWVLLGLAVLFLFLFLVTVGGCAAWNRQSYHPHPNRRSRHQGAKVRSGQQRVPPPIAPLETSSNGHQSNTHASRSHKENSENKPQPRRLTSHNQSNVTSTHRRPRQPPPSLPPLLTKDAKRN